MPITGASVVGVGRCRGGQIRGPIPDPGALAPWRVRVASAGFLCNPHINEPLPTPGFRRLKHSCCWSPLNNDLMQLAGLPALFCEVAEANFVALWRGLSDTANDHTEPDIGNTMVGHGDHSRHR